MAADGEGGGPLERPPREAETPIEEAVSKRARTGRENEAHQAGGINERKPFSQLKKKLQRIEETEKKAAEGKALTKEQENLLASKQSIQGALEELHHVYPRVEEAGARQREAGREEGRREGLSEEDAEQRAKSALEHVLRAVYFGQLFDLSDPLLNYKRKERQACVSYLEQPQEEAEGTMDKLARMARLLTQRRFEAFCSHEEALRQCADHAMKLIGRSNEEVPSLPGESYASLSDKASSIASSDFFTVQPVHPTSTSEHVVPHHLAPSPEGIPPVQAQPPPAPSAPDHGFSGPVYMAAPPPVAPPASRSSFDHGMEAAPGPAPVPAPPAAPTAVVAPSPTSQCSPSGQGQQGRGGGPARGGGRGRRGGGKANGSQGLRQEE